MNLNELRKRQVLALHACGLRDAEIAAMVGYRQAATVCGVRKRLGLESNDYLRSEGWLGKNGKVMSEQEIYAEARRAMRKVKEAAK